MSRQQKEPRAIPDNEWELHRVEFRHMYMNQDKTLKQCQDHFRETYSFEPSEKQWKNRIKKWDCGKYFKGNEAAAVARGENAPARISHMSSSRKNAREKAERSQRRKHARNRGADVDGLKLINSTSTLELKDAVAEREETQMIRTPTQTLMPIPRSGHLMSTMDENLLRQIRYHIHEAFLRDVWSTDSATQHQPGRQAARSLASELAAGRNFFEDGDVERADLHWSRARECFKNASLLETWYSETPVRLLFEIGRMAHAGHKKIAKDLLMLVKDSADKYLTEDGDIRHRLFTAIADVNVDQLRELHSRAATCQYDGLKLRLDKNHHMLYETRLNRALDILYFNPRADIDEWMASIEDMDRELGNDNAYSIYFLLLQAYREIALDSFDRAEEISKNVNSRLELVKDKPDRIDMYRVGLAYRRMGRQMHSKQRYTDARRTMATALKHLKKTKHDSSVLIEIIQMQLAMAKEVKDDVEEYIWSSTLDKLNETNEKEAADRALMWRERGRKRGFIEAADEAPNPPTKRSCILGVPETNDFDVETFPSAVQLPRDSGRGQFDLTTSPSISGYYELGPSMNDPIMSGVTTASPTSVFSQGINNMPTQLSNTDMSMLFPSMLAQSSTQAHYGTPYTNSFNNHNQSWYNQTMTESQEEHNLPSPLNQWTPQMAAPVNHRHGHTM